MSFRSNAAEHERDQLGCTNTSVRRDLFFVEVSPQPLSSSGARQLSPMIEICEAVMKAVVPCDYIATCMTYQGMVPMNVHGLGAV